MNNFRVHGIPDILLLLIYDIKLNFKPTFI